MPIENERRRAQRVAQEKGQILILALDSCCFSLSCYACVCARVARENQALARDDWYAHESVKSVILRQVRLFVVMVMVVMPTTSLP